MAHEGIIHAQDFFGIGLTIMVLSKREYVGGSTGVIKEFYQKKKRQKECESLRGCNLLKAQKYCTRDSNISGMQGSWLKCKQCSYSPGTIWEGNKALLAANRVENA